jgi:polysaccharide biosynthesis protein PelA
MRIGWPSNLLPVVVIVIVVIPSLVVGARAASGDPRAGEAAAALPDVAFHYGSDPPVESLAFFQIVVLDPARLPARSESGSPEPGGNDGSVPRRLARAGSHPIARLPVVMTPTQAPTTGITSLVARALALQRSGFAGVLLEVVAGATERAPIGRKPDVAAPVLVALTRAVRTAWPGAIVMLEAEPELAAGVGEAGAPLDALVVRDLFAAGRASAHRTTARPSATANVTANVASRLVALMSRPALPHIPVVAVERFSPTRGPQARALAEDILAMGFVPWIGPADRSGLGTGTLEAIPRRVLVVLDNEEDPDLTSSVAHRFAAMPLEYLGFAVDYVDVRAAALPEGVSDLYAGIVTWFTDDELPAPARFEAWLGHQLDGGVRLAIMGHLGFAASPAFLARLGLEPESSPLRGPLRIERADAMLGFEAPPPLHAREANLTAAAPSVASPVAGDGRPSAHAGEHMVLRDVAGKPLVPVFVRAWGGVALDPYVLAPGLEGRQRWIVDPFAFFSEALDLPAIPVPDPTTRNGRRVLEVHVDGDGFVSVAELADRPFAGEVIRREFLTRYPWPTTVSVIEGEVGPSGLYPADSPRLEAIARKIFRLPNVEIASHTYSHPFDWVRAGARPGSAAPDEAEAETGADPEADTDRPRDEEGPHDHDHEREREPEQEEDETRLAIPGYVYSVQREVDGSVAYIDGRLAPPGKRTRAFLWSGTAFPPEEAIARADALGLENINGENAEEPANRPSLAQVPSFVRPVGHHLQVYAPGQNENVYTNLWHGPFYGFRRVIDYFMFTESPRRLKPIGIYYHFYSGTKSASIKALHDVYAWAGRQETFPVFASEYARSVRGFEDAVVARRISDGAWRLRGLGSLRTLRLPRAPGWAETWPDLDRSTAVLGSRQSSAGRYVALGADDVTLVMAQAPTAGPYLESANAAAESWQRRGGQVSMRLQGHVPVDVTIGGCPAGVAVDATGSPGGVTTPRLLAGGSSAGPAGASTSSRLLFTKNDTGEIHVRCR